MFYALRIVHHVPRLTPLSAPIRAIRGQRRRRCFSFLSSRFILSVHIRAHPWPKEKNDNI
jgi:hypothetical protein